MAARRIDPEQARRDVGGGNALLVCAYGDQDKCQKYRVMKGLSLAELQDLEAVLPKDREIIFYCA